MRQTPSTDARASASSGDVERRLSEIEAKLDRILKTLERRKQ